MISYLTVEEILRLHYLVINDFGGSHGVRDEGRLLSVQTAPQLVAFGKEQYPTLYEKAAVYLRNIIADHPFINGNKRTAVTVCGVFLMRNSTFLTSKPKELENFAVLIATDHLKITVIAAWLKAHTVQKS